MQRRETRKTERKATVSSISWFSELKERLAK